MKWQRYIGIPYSRRGAGLTCWQLVERVRREVYGVDTPLACDLNDPVDYMAAVRNMQRVICETSGTLPWQLVSAPGTPGDVVLMATAPTAPLHHAGVVVDGGVLHAYEPRREAGGSVVFTPWERMSPTFKRVEVYSWRG